MNDLSHLCCWALFTGKPPVPDGMLAVMHNVITAKCNVQWFQFLKSQEATHLRAVDLSIAAQIAVIWDKKCNHAVSVMIVQCKIQHTHYGVTYGRSDAALKETSFSVQRTLVLKHALLTVQSNCLSQAALIPLPNYQSEEGWPVYMLDMGSTLLIVSFYITHCRLEPFIFIPLAWHWTWWT